MVKLTEWFSKEDKTLRLDRLFVSKHFTSCCVLGGPSLCYLCSMALALDAAGAWASFCTYRTGGFGHIVLF